jgi:hypothetical protein
MITEYNIKRLKMAVTIVSTDRGEPLLEEQRIGKHRDGK